MELGKASGNPVARRSYDTFLIFVNFQLKAHFALTCAPIYAQNKAK